MISLKKKPFFIFLSRNQNCQQSNELKSVRLPIHPGSVNLQTNHLCLESDWKIEHCDYRPTNFSMGSPNLNTIFVTIRHQFQLNFWVITFAKPINLKGLNIFCFFCAFIYWHFLMDKQKMKMTSFCAPSHSTVANFAQSVALLLFCSFTLSPPSETH